MGLSNVPSPLYRFSNESIFIINVRHQSMAANHQTHFSSRSSTDFLRNHILYRFNECPLSLQDQVYLIFQEQHASSLPFHTIRDGLAHRFGTQNADQCHVQSLRFLHYSVADDVVDFLRGDTGTLQGLLLGDGDKGDLLQVLKSGGAKAVPA